LLNTAVLAAKLVSDVASGPNVSLPTPLILRSLNSYSIAAAEIPGAVSL